MTTLKQAIMKVIAEKMREFYLRGQRDAHLDMDGAETPPITSEFFAGELEDAHDKDVWMKLAEDVLDI